MTSDCNSNLDKLVVVAVHSNLPEQLGRNDGKLVLAAVEHEHTDCYTMGNCTLDDDHEYTVGSFPGLVCMLELVVEG
jgi:hypothetical protein